MDDQQFERLMEAIDGGNAHLRSIRAWVQIVGGLMLLGVVLAILGAATAVAGS